MVAGSNPVVLSSMFLVPRAFNLRDSSFYTKQRKTTLGVSLPPFPSFLLDEAPGFRGQASGTRRFCAADLDRKRKKSKRRESAAMRLPALGAQVGSQH